MPRSSKETSTLETSAETKKPKSYGERVPFKKFFKFRVRISATDWETIEEGFGLELQDEQRDRIQMFSNLYSNIGPLYSDSQSVLARTAKTEIEAWRKATGRLLRALSPIEVGLVDLMPKIKDNGLLNLSGLTPVGLVAFAALFARLSSENALGSLSDGKRNGRIQNDLWAAWACLVTREIKSAGFKVTRASADWSQTAETPYVVGMQALQSHLSQECQHYSTSESMLNGAKQADKQFGELSEQTLLKMLVGWGGQQLFGYPGSLLRTAEENIAAFEEFAGVALEEAIRLSLKD